MNSVVPGLMTPMRTSVVSADPVMRARFFERVPINREGTAQEAAKAVLFLSSEDARTSPALTWWLTVDTPPTTTDRQPAANERHCSVHGAWSAVWAW